MPQTAATIEQRNEAMEAICQRYPEVGWRLCIDQFGRDSGIGHYSARPHWHNDAAGAGQTVKTWNEVFAVTNKARALALAWPHHNEKTLGDLAERLQQMPDTEQQQVWALIKAWAETNPDDTARHILRERVRQTTLYAPRPDSAV